MLYYTLLNGMNWKLLYTLYSIGFSVLYNITLRYWPSEYLWDLSFEPPNQQVTKVVQRHMAVEVDQQEMEMEEW